VQQDKLIKVQGIYPNPFSDRVRVYYTLRVDAAVAMERGVDGVLMNTAIAEAQDPVRMAEAMRLGVDAGRRAFLAGRMPRREYAQASSPVTGTVSIARPQ
jgi:thiazole synthase ThiGH ThiG subunit